MIRKFGVKYQYKLPGTAYYSQKPKICDMNRLQISLLLNAVFSGISGFTLVLFKDSIARLFGTKNSTVFWVVGALLIFFTCTIILEIIKQRPLAVLWIIVQDSLWVIGSIILLVFNPFDITFAGNVIIAIVAVIVLAMALNQSKALTRLDDGDKTGKESASNKTINKLPNH
jgi:hypothetical protein